MHTTIPTDPPVSEAPHRLSDLRQRFWYGALVAVVVAFTGVISPKTSAQSAFPGTSNTPSVNVRVYPSDFWGPRVGPGAGIGVVGHNLLRRHDQWLLTAAPALHEQIATASMATSNPRRARQYLLLDTRALHTDRDWLGPSTSGKRTVLSRSSLRSRVRAGQTFLETRLLIQPQLTLVHHNITDIDGGESTVPADIGRPPASLRRGRYTGIRIGGALEFDTRDDHVLARRGVLLQAEWDRYIATDESAVHFDQVDLDAYGYLPLGGLHRLVARTSVTVTNPLNRTPVPVVMLPVLGGTVVPGWARGRFVDHDRAIGSVLYRFPLRKYGNLALIEGHVGLHAASVYRDLSDQFDPSISFREPVSLEDSSRPLRPSASAGIRLAVPFRTLSSVDLAVGVTPEGVSAVRFSFVRSLQAVRPPHHVSHNLR